jgi:hypothetical protein
MSKTQSKQDISEEQNNDQVKVQCGTMPKELDRLVPLTAIPEKYFHEIVTDKLLMILQKLFNIMLKKPGG